MSRLYTFDIKKLQTDTEFGSGPMGAVHPYRRRANDERWVGKYLLTKNFEEFQVINRGVNLNCNHDHPSILCPKTVYITECKPKGYRVLVKYPRMKGSLKTLIEGQREQFQKAPKGSKEFYFSKQQIIQYFYSILVGLEYLEKKGIAHTNLKPTNILIAEDGRIRLNDIGLAKEFIETDTGSFLIHKRGPEFYQAPEIFMDNRPQRKCELLKVDMWSLGMIMAELCLLTPENMFPFSPLDQRRQRVKEYVEQITKIYGEDIAGLIEQMLKLDPSERKTASQMAGIVREMYPGIKELGKTIEEEKGAQRMMNPVQIVSEDLQHRFGTTFKFDYKKGFAVKAGECTNVNDATLEDLIKGIKGKVEEQKMERLEQLALNLRGCQKITNAGFKISVSKIAIDFQKLKNFSLSIGPKGVDEICEVTDDGLKHLSTNLSQNLTGLQNLSLDFNGCANISEAAIKQLVTDVTDKMKNLQGLSLEFGQDPQNKAAKQVTDDTLDYISSTISSQLGNLKQLSLAFRGYIDITDKGLKSLESHIRKLTGLTQLSLKFYRCDNVTGEGVKKLASSIDDSLRSMHHLTFVFSWCEKVSVEDKKHIKDILRMVPKLTL